MLDLTATTDVCDTRVARAAPWLPWASCNLRRNPFGELTGEERAELAVVDVDKLIALASESHCALQLIGDCGRGKTTRLLAIRHRLPESSYVYLPEYGPCPAIAEGRPLLIDEAQRLPKAVRRRVFSTGLPLVLATHRRLDRTLRKSGYHVHTDWIGEDNTAELLQRLLNRRISASRLQDGPVPVLSIDVADRLVRRFGSDFRGIEQYLYEQGQIQVTRYGEMRFSD